MPRKKIVVEPYATVHVVRSTWQRRWLLLPRDGLDEQVLGIVGRALALEAVRLHGLAVLPDRIELLATVASREELSGFLAHVMKNVSDALERTGRWKGPVWNGRVRIATVAPDEQIDRLRDLVAAPVLDNLVASPLDWPVALADAIVEERAILAFWRERLVPITFTPVPALAAFPRRARQALLRDVLLSRAVRGTAPLGLDALATCSPRWPDPRTPAYADIRAYDERVHNDRIY